MLYTNCKNKLKEKKRKGHIGQLRGGLS